MKRLRLFTIPLVILCLVACAGNQVADNDIATAYKTLLALGTSYDTAMKSLSELHKKGHVGDDVVVKAKEYGTLYHAAYHSAVEALEMTQEGKSISSVYESIAVAQVHYAALVGYLMPIIQRYVVEVDK